VVKNQGRSLCLPNFVAIACPNGLAAIGLLAFEKKRKKGKKKRKKIVLLNSFVSLLILRILLVSFVGFQVFGV